VVYFQRGTVVIAHILACGHPSLPDTRSCAFSTTPYSGKTPDAYEGPSCAAHRLVWPLTARRALGVARP